MAQHFLLSADARTLKLKTIYRMSDTEAFETFTKIPQPTSQNAGVPPVGPAYRA